MKKTVFLLALLFSGAVWAQSIIENPKCGMSKESYVTLEKVELTDAETILHFNVKIRSGFHFTISDYTYIQPLGGEKLVIKDAEGIVVGEQFKMPKDGETSYQLIFPAIDKETARIDYSQGIGSGAWFIYDIQLKNEQKISKVPDEIYGKWRNLNTGALELCLFDTVAVYKSKVWQYKKVKYKGEKGSLLLSANGETQMLYVFNTMDGLMVGEEKENVDLLVRNRSVRGSDDIAFTSPVLSTDSAIYSGYVYKYNPRCGVNKLTLVANDVIAGSQKEYTVEIQKNGYFSAKIPLYYPHQVYMQCNFFMTSTLYLEPGKELFHVISFEFPRSKTHEYMGELASVNNEWEKIKRLESFPASKARKEVLDMTAHEFAVYVKKYWNEDVQKLNEKLEQGSISDKVFQIKKMGLDYGYTDKLLSYSTWYRSAYSRKHKVSRNTRNLEIEIDSMSVKDLAFITNEFVNNDLALISNEYYYFINRFKYSDFLRTKTIRMTALQGIEDYLEEHPHPSKTDAEIIAMMRAQDSLFKLPENMAYQKKYRKTLTAFYRNHRATFTHLRDSIGKQPKPTEVAQYLTDKGEVLSEEEKELMKATEAKLNSKASIEFNERYGSIPQDSVTAFYKKIKPYNNLDKQKRDLRINRLAENFNVKEGLMTDIMFVQGICDKMVDQLTPLSDEELDKKIEEIRTPFIAAYLKKSNEETLATIAYRKEHPIASKQAVPDVANDKLFASIMENYEGKVVYVDLWATWCAPCRSGIQRIAPLKDEMEDEDVAFVYITGETSPVNTWENMIPGIKGDHYRLSKAQWSYLRDTYKVTGIPHCMLVDKTGALVDDHLPYLSNGAIKEKLETEMLK